MESSASAKLAEGGTEIILDGPPYTDLLAAAHRRLRPRTYFEIGSRRGSSLRVARCTSLAVDPNFQLEEGVVGSKPVVTLHQSTSDEFFASRDPIGILGGHPGDPEPPPETGPRFRSQNDVLRAKLEAMRNSRSWRITRPLRSFRKPAAKS
jgi:hypothetical protein